MPDTTSPLDPDPTLLPSAEDVRFYAEHGWYLSPKLLTDDEVGTLVEASERYYAGERDRELPHHPAKLSYWTPADGDVQRNNDYIHYESDAIAEILRKPEIAATALFMAQGPLAGGQEIFVDSGQHLLEQPRDVIFLAREGQPAA